MEALAQKCTRLLGALEDLARHERACRAMGDVESLHALQRRAEPLVDWVGRCGPKVADEAVRGRLRTWLAHRRATEAWLAEQMAQASARLSQIDATRGRIAQVGPAYARRNEGARRQFTATG